MIEVRGVQPTARELRHVTSGWGGLHWWQLAHQLLPFAGLWVLAVFVWSRASWHPELTSAVSLTVIVTTFLWLSVRSVLNRVTLQAARQAPGGGMLSDWTIDGTGLAFGTPVASSRIGWEGIKAVREEKDRFIFLMSPAANPVLPKRHLSEDQQAALRQLVADVTAANRIGRGVD
ncbi:hypothetical protein GCM10009422_28730 [Brevundimonas kwangchunensis]|uniref:YcxB-like C-terminal domain-containing protein n=1 Tax=Brevundimonas kwangchunensis TaxID=322163 RepID=A0ABN1H5K8_9CAUL